MARTTCYKNVPGESSAAIQGHELEAERLGYGLNRIDDYFFRDGLAITARQERQALLVHEVAEHGADQLQLVLGQVVGAAAPPPNDVFIADAAPRIW